MATATKATRKKAAPAKKSEPTYDVKLSSIYATLASRRNKDAATVAKTVRGKMRSNFDMVVSLSPNVSQHKESANDGKAWPVFVSSELRDFLLGDTNTSPVESESASE